MGLGMPDRGVGDQAPDRESVHNVARDVTGSMVQSGAIHGDVHIHAAVPAQEWPRRVGVVPLRADCFQDREVGTELSIVDTGGTVVLTQVLSGLGGVGKTQLAARYAERLWDNGNIDLLVWVTAASRDAIISGYADAARDILGAAAGEGAQAARKFLAWLAADDRRWLLVLDDVQDPAHLRELWPPHRDTGRVVVTTRRRDAALSGDGRRLVEVGLFSADEAVAYLTAKLVDRPQQTIGAAELAEDLGYLPLALAQAAAYLVDRNLTCAEYRARLADRRRRLGDLLPDDSGLPDNHRATVAATWSMSIELADQLAPVGLARPLLELASLLDPNSIPANVFTSSAVVDYLADVRDAVVHADDAWDALHCLHRLNLATVDVDSPLRTVRVHALVQRATREQLAASRLAGAARTVADALVEIWPLIERDPNLGQMLRASTEALHTHAEAYLWQPEGHAVLLRAGSSLGEAGLVAAAVTYFDSLHAIATRRLGVDHQNALVARGNLAWWRGESGDVVGAVREFELLLGDCVRVLGADHPNTLRAQSNLAYWREQAGDGGADRLGQGEVKNE
jgi:hypothetical protein